MKSLNPLILITTTLVSIGSTTHLLTKVKRTYIWILILKIQYHIRIQVEIIHDGLSKCFTNMTKCEVITTRVRSRYRSSYDLNKIPTKD